MHNDATIAALPSYLNDRGLHSPDDLSVVGVFSREFGQTFSLPYTAVETSPDRLGQLAVQQLIRRITDPDAAGVPMVRLIEPTLTDRGSTGPAA